MHTRRNLLIVLGVTTVTPGFVFAQAQKKPVLIGWLSASSRVTQGHWLQTFKDSLAALGWKEGAQIVIEERFSDGHDNRLLTFAQEFAARPATLILAQGLRAAISASKAAPNIPVVMVSNNDPVAAGVVASLARPGGMVTGIAGFAEEYTGKHVELLLEAAPKMKRVGFLVASKSARRDHWIELARRSTVRFGVDAHVVEVAERTDIEPAITRLAKEGVQALVMFPNALLISERPRIARLALAHRWPVVGSSEWAVSGGLIGYSADLAANYRRAAHYVDRILKGAKPADLPIEQPTKFEFVLNMKTAKALGLTMPPEIMVRVDRVIE